MGILYFTAVIFLFVIIAFTWYALDQLEVSEKVLFIIIGLVVALIVTNFLFNLSARHIEYPAEGMLESVRKATVLAIMPINAILFMPYIGKEIGKLKFEEITQEHFAKQMILLALLLIVLAIFEYKYLIKFQMGILDIMKSVK